MKKMTIALMLVSLTGIAYANCGNGNGNGNGCSGDTGPAGPQGPQGNPGTNGSNGANGSNGSNGSNGVNGSDGVNGATGSKGDTGDKGEAASTSAQLVVDTAVRLYDGKYAQFQVFNIYGLDTTRHHDVVGDGKNVMFGARVVFKLGKSYEERRIEKLERLLGIK